MGWQEIYKEKTKEAAKTASVPQEGWNALFAEKMRKAGMQGDISRQNLTPADVAPSTYKADPSLLTLGPIRKPQKKVPEVKALGAGTPTVRQKSAAETEYQRAKAQRKTAQAEAFWRKLQNEVFHTGTARAQAEAESALQRSREQESSSKTAYDRNKAFSGAELAKHTLFKGATQVAKQGSSAAAWIEDALAYLPEKLAGLEPGTISRNGLFHKLDQGVSADAQAVDAAAQANIAKAKHQKAAAKVYEYGGATVAAIPQAVMAVLTAGASSAGGMANLAREGYYAGKGAYGAITNGLLQMQKDPNYWTAFASVVGPGYEQARQDGASQEKATLYALGNGLINAAVEVGGGIQTLPKQMQSGASAWRAWVSSMLDEGKEEVVQGVVERAMQNAAYQKGNKTFGADGEAILNPKAAAQEFAGGAVVGGILGGGQMAAQRLLRGPGAQNNTPANIRQETAENTVEGPQIAVEAPLAQESAVQEAPNAQYVGVAELLGAAKRGRMSAAEVAEKYNSPEGAAYLQEELNSGKYGVDAKDNIFLVNPEEHIDNRGNIDISDRRVNAFQFDHPELHPYYVEAANVLKSELNDAQPGGELVQTYEYMGGKAFPTFRRLKRGATENIVALKDTYKLTYEQIGQAIDAILADKGQENYAAAKKVELVLDDMLSHGYHDSTAGRIGPNVEYLRRKAALEGTQTDSADIAKAENERAWTQRIQEADSGSFDGQMDPQEAAEFAQRPLPEDWVQQMEGQEPPERETFIPEETAPINDGLGGADRGSLNTAFQEMQAQSRDFYPVNPNAEERIIREQNRAPSEVPEVNPYSKKNITKAVSTILNAPITSPEMAPILEQSVAGGRFDYVPITDQAALDYANLAIKQDGGYTKAAERFLLRADLGQRVTKNEFTLGIQCYNEAVSAGDTALAMELSEKLADVAHDSAQVTQAMQIFNRLTPAGKLLTLRRYVDKLNRGGKPRARRRGDNLTAGERRAAFLDDMAFAIDETLATDYLMAETEDARAQAWDSIISDLASKQPPTLLEKWNYWRYTSMLTNPTTHVRNFVGNAAQVALRKTKNAVALALEKAAGVDSDERTKARLTNSPADNALKEFALQMYADDQSRAMGGGKYQEGSAAGIAREIQEARKMFGEKYKVGELVQKVGEKNSALLDKADIFFNKPAYVESLAQALKARGITAEEAMAGVRPEQVAQCREYAMQEAAKATYRDFNQFSDAISRIGNLKQSDNFWVRGLGHAADAILPFRRTPANILVRGIEYSPVGLMRGIKQAAFDVKSGRVSASQAIDTLASGLTGSGIMALGALLAKLGMLKLKPGRDDKEHDFLKSIGYQDFALQIGDTSYTLDWLVPGAMPLFAGAAIIEGCGNDRTLTDAAADAILGINDVILETSMLSSLDDMLENISYAKLPAWYFLSKTLTSYISQGVPTALGKVANAMDSRVRKAFVPGNAGTVSKDLQYFAQGTLRKVPGVRNTMQPLVDVWGQEVQNGSFPERLAESFISPGFMSVVKDDPVTKEVRRLAGQVGSGVYPAKAAQAFTVNKERVYLTAEQYTKYAKLLGQERHDILLDALQLPAYENLTDERKAELVSTAYKYANDKAKAATIPGYEVQMTRYAEAERQGIPPAEWWLLNEEAEAYGGGKAGTVEALDASELTEWEKAAIFPLFNKSWKNPYEDK